MFIVEVPKEILIAESKFTRHVFLKSQCFRWRSGNPFLFVLRYTAHPSKVEIFGGGKQLFANIHAV